MQFNHKHNRITLLYVKSWSAITFVFTRVYWLFTLKYVIFKYIDISSSSETSDGLFSSLGDNIYFHYRRYLESCAFETPDVD